MTYGATDFNKPHFMKRTLFITPLFLVLPLAALAADVSVSEDVTVQLPSDNSTYTVKSGSGFDSIGVDSGTISFTSSGSGTVDLRSGGRANLTNSRNIAVTCSDSESSISISSQNGDTSVTPSGTCGTSGGGGGTSGGGGGGGGGGGFGSAPAVPAPATVSKVADLKQQLAMVQAAIAQKIAQSSKSSPSEGSAVSIIAKNLGMGNRGKDVSTLQQLLGKDKDIYPEGTVSGYFGPATARAIQKFQLKYGVIKKATDPGSGNLGPKTKAKLQEVFGSSASVPAMSPVAPPAGPAPSSLQSSTTVAPDVKAVQEQIQALQAKLLQQQVKLLQEKINAIKK